MNSVELNNDMDFTDFQKEKERIRGIFKKKGISEEFLELPCVMEMVLGDDFLEKNIIKCENDDGVVYTPEPSTKIIFKKQKDNSLKAIMEFHYENFNSEHFIDIDEYGFEKKREVHTNNQKVLEIKRSNRGMNIATQYNEGIPSAKFWYLDNGECFLFKFNGVNGQLTGHPILIKFGNDNQDSQQIKPELDFNQVEKEYIQNKKRMETRYPKTRPYYEELDENIGELREFIDELTSRNYQTEAVYQKTDDGGVYGSTNQFPNGYISEVPNGYIVSKDALNNTNIRVHDNNIGVGWREKAINSSLRNSSLRNRNRNRLFPESPYQ